MREPIVVLSDLHLGRAHGAAHEALALRPLWADAGTLVLNGDVAEVHHPAHWGAAVRQTLRLFDQCERDGVELVVLSGNHDPYISDRRHLELASGLVFVTHGDAFHPAIAPWSPAAGRMRTAHAEALARLEPHRRDLLVSRLTIAQHAAFAEWAEVRELEREALHSTLLGMALRPWRLAQVLYYWHVFPSLAARFAAAHAPRARFVVVGHTHRAGVRRHGPRTVVNTGSFGLPGRPHGVVVAGDRLEYRRIVPRGDAYGWAPRPRASFVLASADDAPPAPSPE